jgi:organic radical activating enzyme
LQKSLINEVKVIELNTTNFCNLSCGFCPHSKIKMIAKTMSPDLIRRIKKEIDSTGFTGVLSLSGRGEITLNKDFEQILEILSTNKKYTLKISTNGAKLSNEHIDFIINNDIKVHYNNYEPNKNEERASIIQRIRTYKNAIYQTFTTTELKDSPTYTNRTGIIEDSQVQSGVCTRPMTKLFIDWDGSYRLCCEDWLNIVDLGMNINTTPINEYLSSNYTLFKYSNNLQNGDRTNLTPCDKCTYKE